MRDCLPLASASAALPALLAIGALSRTKRILQSAALLVPATAAPAAPANGGAPASAKAAVSQQQLWVWDISRPLHLSATSSLVGVLDLLGQPAAAIAACHV